MVAVMRGLMLLMSSSPTSIRGSVVLSTPSLSFSSLCRCSSWQQQQQQPIGPGGRRIATCRVFQSTSSSPIFSISTWVVNPTRAFHEPPGTERRGLEGKVVAFRAEYIRISEKRLGWKRIPVFRFSDIPNWSGRGAQGYLTQSFGNGHVNNWEAIGGGGVIISRAYSNSTSAAERADDGLKTVKQRRERGNDDQRRPARIQEDLQTSIGTSSNGSYFPSEGNSRNTQVSERPSPPSQREPNYGEKLAKSSVEGARSHSLARERPPFKPKANYSENRAEFSGEGDGRSWPAKGKAPFKPKANYYESNGKSVQSRGRVDGRTSPGSRRPALKPKSSDCDKRTQSRGAEGDLGSSQASNRPPFIPKANYYDNPEKARKTVYSDNMGQSKREDRNNHSSKFSRDQNGENLLFRERGSGDGPHYGNKFRDTGLERGQFRKIGPQESSPAVADVQRKTGKFRESEAVKWRNLSDSSRTNSLNPNQISSKEDGEVRKFPPRRLEGEKKWQYAVRKKQLGLAGHTRGSTKKRAPEFVDDESLGNEPQGDDWRRKKTAWLCKEIPNLRPRPIVSILNDQRKWIKAEDTKYIIEHLLQIHQTLRAHRVLKWEMQQPWHEFDFALSSKVAIQLGQYNKLSRTKDIYDLIIKNGKTPDLPTYEVLINCYVVDGENAALIQAWSLYNQMSQLGGHEPSPTLTYNLFQGLIQKGLTFLDQADELFKRIKMSGLVCSTEMYNLLMNVHGTKGNNDRVDDLIKEMTETGLPVGQDVYSAILRSCAKDGNVATGEQAFADLQMTGQKLNPSVYASLIKMYGKAGLPEKACQIFEQMRDAGTSPGLTVYEPMIEVLVLSGNREQAEKLLKEAQEKGTPSLHRCYNSVMELYSKQGLLDEADRLFNEMDGKGYPPNQASFNVLLEAYVRHHLVENSEAVIEKMRQSDKAKPNKRTYELLIKLYGEAKNSEKLKEVFKELADKNFDVPKEASRYLEAAVSPKQLEAHRNAQLKLRREHREILAGVMLAGAGVETHDKNRTYELHFELDPDSEVGLPLINHLYQEFADWSTEPPSRQLLPDPKNPKMSKILLAFQTISHGSFRFFAHQYRPKPNHSAVIPRLVHRWLTPRALAYWYMYGGNKCPQSGDILLNASAYSDKEIMLVVNALKSRTVDCEKKKTSSGLAICVNGRSAMWLWGLMEPHILAEVRGLLKPEDNQGVEDLMQQL